jgi:endonuclease/exonuclease/phosphatase family metal-dependent hydrolase
VDDPDDAWMREPMVTCLVAGTTDLCIVSIHVVFGDRVGPRDAEIRALAGLVGALREGGEERDYLVVGDFNRAGSADSFEAFAPGGLHFADDGMTRTTISATQGWRNPYDHVLLDSGATSEWAGDAERVDFVASECGGDFALCAASISDHGPLRVTLDVSGGDDD